MLITILIFVIILGILVFVHEFGHFIVAKKSGMVVHEFGFGFPPRLAGIQRISGKWRFVLGHKAPEEALGHEEPENTIYSINAIPLGGFVKIKGENNEHEDDARSFVNKPFWPRFFTLVAGVVMNFLLAWVIFSVGFFSGLPAAFDDSSQIPQSASFENGRIAIIDVAPKKPAEAAGLKQGDFLLQIDGRQFASAEAVRDYIKANAGKVLVFKIERGGQSMDISVPSQSSEDGPTGIALSTLGRLSYPWYLAPWEGFKTAVSQITGIFTGLYRVITSGLGLKALGGPVKIAQLTGQVADMGFIYLLQFTAFLSLNLAALNILPFPALDGGRVLFLIIEKIRGKKNNQKIEQYANAAGFALLLLLMLLVTIKDVRGI